MWPWSNSDRSRTSMIRIDASPSHSDNLSADIVVSPVFVAGMGVGVVEGGIGAEAALLGRTWLSREVLEAARTRGLACESPGTGK